MNEQVLKTKAMLSLADNTASSSAAVCHKTYQKPHLHPCIHLNLLSPNGEIIIITPRSLMYRCSLVGSDEIKIWTQIGRI